MKNILWPIINFQKYFMAHQYMPNICHASGPPSCILNIRSLTKNIWYSNIIFSSTTPTFSLQLSYISPNDGVKLNILIIALFIVCQMTQCIVLTVHWFFCGKKGPLVSLSKECKSYHNINENQRLHQGNKYHKDARKVAPESVRISKKHIILFLTKLMML